MHATGDVNLWKIIISSAAEPDAEGDRVPTSAWRWSGVVPLLVGHRGPSVGTVRPYGEGDRLMGVLQHLSDDPMVFSTVPRKDRPSWDGDCRPLRAEESKRIKDEWRRRQKEHDTAPARRAA